MRLHDLSPKHGAKHRTKRLGCGESSGHGKTSGRGHKGQRARSGGSVRIGFEGGQMPMHRRLPKRGFSNVRFQNVYAIVNVGQLDSFDEGAVIDADLLLAHKFIRGQFVGLKILGTGELTKKFEIKAHKCSDSAKAKIEQAGGTLTLVTPWKAPVAEKA